MQHVQKCCPASLSDLLQRHGSTASRCVCGAYLSLLRRIKTNGKHSRCLWGPGEGLGAYTSNSSDGLVILCKGSSVST